MTGMENLLIAYNDSEWNSSTRGILREILLHSSEVGSSSIYQLADLCYTSAATLSRMIRKLGYSSYQAFQHAVSTCVHSYEHHNRLLPKVDSYRSGDPVAAFMEAYGTLCAAMSRNLQRQKLRRLSELLHEAKRVTVFSYGNRFIENSLQSDLFISGIPCDVVVGDRMQTEACSGLEKGSLAIFAWPDCFESAATLHQRIAQARERGATICIVSTNPSLSEPMEPDLLFAFEGRQGIIDAFVVELFFALLTIEYRSYYLDGRPADLIID